MDTDGWFIYRVTDIKPISGYFGIYVGEAAHNFRGALDHLMFLIARPTEGEKERVQFPLYSRRRKFRRSQCMPGIPRGAKTIFESLQPYDRRKKTEALLLRQLREISNWDKHRAISTTAAQLNYGELIFEFSGKQKILRQEYFRGCLEPGTVLARLKLSDSAVGSKVNVNSKLSFTPVFGSGMPKELKGIPILNTLALIGEFIENGVIAKLSRFV